jgi:hypothetical protein
MDDTVARFWDKYINKTTACNVPEGARRWYVKHVEALISAHPDHRLAELGTAEIIKYLEVIVRKLRNKVSEPLNKVKDMT